MQEMCKRWARPEPGSGRPAQPLAGRPPSGSSGPELALSRHKCTQDDPERRIQSRFDQMDRKAGWHLNPSAVRPKPTKPTWTRAEPTSGQHLERWCKRRWRTDPRDGRSAEPGPAGPALWRFAPIFRVAVAKVGNPTVQPTFGPKPPSQAYKWTPPSPFQASHLWREE